MLRVCVVAAFVLESQLLVVTDDVRNTGRTIYISDGLQPSQLNYTMVLARTQCFPFGELGQLGLRANMARVLPEPTRAKLAHDARVPTLKSQFLPRSLLLGCFEQWDD